MDGVADELSLVRSATQSGQRLRVRYTALADVIILEGEQNSLESRLHIALAVVRCR